MATTTYEPLGTYTVSGSSTNSITFNSIAGYTDLYIVGQYGIITSVDKYLRITFNGDTTASNYSMTNMRGNDATPSSNRYSGAGGIYDVTAMGTSKSSLLSMARINIMNYSNSTTYKTFMSRVDNDYDGLMGALASVSLWQNTAPITSVTITTNDGTNFYNGSKFDIYGIANAVIEAPKATGGTITYDNTYFYHTFGASSTFTPQQSLTADILVVAGGGGGSAAAGGAGGLLGFASQSLSATGYTVTVGNGGAGVSGAGSQGSNGGDSQFGALTLVKGGGGGAAGGGGAVSGSNGGSGGGAFMGGASNTGAIGYGGSPTSGQGNAGGNTYPQQSSKSSTGGGGGAGAAGETPTQNDYAGAGGIGLSTYSSWGLATGTGENVAGTVYYAGGGGGGYYVNGTNLPGGYGGGGSGTTGNAIGVTNGKPNTGGGGGGAYSPTYSQGGNGGSGVVIIRYLKA